MRKTTSDEAEIRQWATKYRAHPIEKAPFTPDGVPAMLGFEFGDQPVANQSLQPITWGRFMAVFKLLELVLVYDGGTSYELVKVENGSDERFEGKLLYS